MVKARRRDAPIARELTRDPDILELARRTSSAIPEAPLQGVDIVREVATGQLFVLEANPGGNTWIFSKGDMSARLKKRAQGLSISAIRSMHSPLPPRC